MRVTNAIFLSGISMKVKIIYCGKSYFTFAFGSGAHKSNIKICNITIQPITLGISIVGKLSSVNILFCISHSSIICIKYCT